MKKLLLSIIAAGTSFCAFAQNPTMDFESWTTMNNGTISVPEEPTNWVTGNQLVSFVSPGNSTSVFKVTGTEAHGGTYAMKIVTVDVVNDPSGGQLPDPTGVAFVGKVQLSPLKLISGFPYTARPTTCTFWHKYTPMASDSASCGVVLTKWNGAKRDTIAIGGIVIKTAASAYTLSTFTLTYDPTFSTVIPDSMILGFSASCLATNTCGVAGSTLWVDDLSFSGYNNVNEHSSSSGVIVYPNPATDHISITSDALESVSVIVFDVMGREVISSTQVDQSHPLKLKTWTLQTTNLVSGVYSYSLNNVDGASLRSGKFTISK